MSPTPSPLDQAGQQLRQVLLRLNQYAKARAAKLDPASKYAAQQKAHLDDLSALFRAVGAYEQAATAGLPEAGPPPAWTLNPHLTPAELLAEREADPVYRLGFVRGHRKGCADTERKYERLTSLYAQYAILVPPPGYQPSPLVQRLTTYLDSPAAQAYAAVPLKTRQALNGLTPGQLNDLVHRQATQGNGID